MAFDRKRCVIVTLRQKANYPYLDISKVAKVVGSIMANRRKEEVAIDADIQPAVLKMGISLQEQRGYRQAAAAYFGINETLHKNGSSYRRYRKHPEKKESTS